MEFMAAIHKRRSPAQIRLARPSAVAQLKKMKILRSEIESLFLSTNIQS
jgi:hypothetical protein